MSYNFKGTIPASKSIMNRALICASYSDSLLLKGDSSCDDVIKMKQAIEKLKTYHPQENQINAPTTIFDCGAAGTVLRFLSLRLSRIPGIHILKGTTRLMQRPQQDLLDVFTRLGIEYQNNGDQLVLKSTGWKNLSAPIEVNRGVSSQFASGLILNAWNLKEDLVLKTVGESISEGYLEMTLQVVKQLGMNIEIESKADNIYYRVKANSIIKPKEYIVESDLSSAFAVAAFAALNGQVVLENFPIPSLQPDSIFVEILKQMKIPVELNKNNLIVKKIESFTGVEVNLNSCPDLFPVLATLCAFANSPSRLFGAPQLVHKESDRIAKISDLLNSLKIPHEKKSDGMLIYPQKISKTEILPFSYDTDHDHRLAFAAALVKSQGLPITILHPEVVTKSFPEFWQVVGL